MPVVTFRITKMSGERNEGKTAKNVEVKSNFRIISMKKEDTEMGKILRVNFSFDVQYKPNMGNMEFDGYLWFREENLDKAVEEKENRIKLKPEAVEEISTVIIRESLLESINMSKKLRLPAPLKLPAVTTEPKILEFAKAA